MAKINKTKLDKIWNPKNWLMLFTVFGKIAPRISINAKVNQTIAYFSLIYFRLINSKISPKIKIKTNQKIVDGNLKSNSLSFEKGK